MEDGEVVDSTGDADDRDGHHPLLLPPTLSRRRVVGPATNRKSLRPSVVRMWRLSLHRPGLEMDTVENILGGRGGSAAGGEQHRPRRRRHSLLFPLTSE